MSGTVRSGKPPGIGNRRTPCDTSGRGNAAIKRQLIDNPNARMSETGFARMVSGINGDKELATALAARQDVPDELRVWLDAVLNPKQA